MEVLVEVEERVNVFQPMVDLEHVVEVLLFYFYDKDDDSSDVYILSLFLYVHLFFDEGFVHTEKHQ